MHCSTHAYELYIRTYFTFCVVGFGTQSVMIPEGESEPLLEIIVTDGFLLNPVTVELEYISGTAEGTMYLHHAMPNEVKTKYPDFIVNCI